MNEQHVTLILFVQPLFASRKKRKNVILDDLGKCSKIVPRKKQEEEEDDGKMLNNGKILHKGEIITVVVQEEDGGQG